MFILSVKIRILCTRPLGTMPRDQAAIVQKDLLIAGLKTKSQTNNGACALLERRMTRAANLQELNHV
jgi:hypothetical protein